MGLRESVVETKPPLHRQSSYDRLIRICVAGCAAGMQTAALIDEFLGYGYRERPMGSIQCDFQNHRVTIDEERVKLQIMNLCGVGYLGLSPVIFRSPHIGLMLLYDVGEERSFDRAKELIADTQQMSPRTSILLVGCHCQKKKERQVTYYTAREFADKKDIPVIEIICAKEGVNIELAFMTLVGCVLSDINLVS